MMVCELIGIIYAKYYKMLMFKLSNQKYKYAYNLKFNSFI